MNEQRDDIDDLYEAFKPRLLAARRSYVRRRLAAALVVPALLGAALPWALADEPEQVSQLASSIERPDEAPNPTPKEASPTAEEANSDKPEEEPQPSLEQAAEPVDLAFAGKAYVKATDDGLLLESLDLNEGWVAQEFGVTKGATLVIVLAHGDTKLVAYVALDDQGKVAAEIDNVTPEPEPEVEVEPEPEVKPTPKPETDKKEKKAKEDKKEEESKKDKKKEKKKKEKEEPEVQTRKEITVGEIGKVVVEREGDKLWLGVAWNHDWWEPVTVTGSGAEVHAYFTNDGVEHHVRAWIKGNKIKYEVWVVEG